MSLDGIRECVLDDDMDSALIEAERAMECDATAEEVELAFAVAVVDVARDGVRHG